MASTFLEEVFSTQDDENTDFLMSMMTSVEDKISDLKQRVLQMITATYVDFSRVPRATRFMNASAKIISERMEDLDSRISNKVVPKLKNSTGLLNKLSTRFTEISLERKIVDELLEINSKFLAANDLQRERLYFEAAKSFQTLQASLEKASNNVKDLKVFKALIDESALARVHLLELMASTLGECLQFEANPNNQIAHHTLQVDMHRTEDMEESFRALHYLGKLDAFFGGFADWLQKNIMLSIILHDCTITSEEDGNFMVLKIDVDNTLPKNDYTKVFENLTLVFTFLRTYLSIGIGENYTLMNELGKITSDDFNTALISYCLADTIPSHSNQLEDYKSVISATEKFHSNLKTFGFLDERNSKLINYTKKAEKLCAKKTTKLLLIKAREIMMKDLYDLMEVEVVGEPLQIKKVKKVRAKREKKPVKMEPAEDTPEKKMCIENESSVLNRVVKVEASEPKESPAEKDYQRKEMPEKCGLNEQGKGCGKEDSEPNKCPFQEGSEQKESIVKKHSSMKAESPKNEFMKKEILVKAEILTSDASDSEESSEENETGGRVTTFVSMQFQWDDDNCELKEPSERELSGVEEREGGVHSEQQKCAAEESSGRVQPKIHVKGTENESSVDESTDEECTASLDTSADGVIVDFPPREIVTKFEMNGVIFAFPKCQISKSANELINLLNDVLNDCIGSSKKCARNLFKTARKIIELYCAIVPVYHKKYLDTMPQQAALFHNNCNYLAHCLLTLGHYQRRLLPNGTQTIGTFADQVTVLRHWGAFIFLKHMHFQRNQILDIIRNCGLSTLRESSTLTADTEKALRQCLRQLELLKSVWQPVLPENVFEKSMACLMNSFLDELISRVVTVEDIPAHTATMLVKMFGVVSARVTLIFPDPKMFQEFKKWEMFQELALILGASMKVIKKRWAEGNGPAAKHFTPEQMRQLIRALFQNTELRSTVLAEIC